MALPDHLADLLTEAAFPHRCRGIELVETHISWVILTGEFAYKLKKPVHFPFVDFSTLERREHFCREELRCNRAFAPTLYLDVVPVTRSDGARVALDGAGEVVEWAVRMRQFPHEAQLDRLLERGGVEPAMLIGFGRSLAARHRSLPSARVDAAAVDDRVLRPMWENFDDVLALPWSHDHRPLLERARGGTERQARSHRTLLQQRLEQGWTRECHGDLHLSNLVLENDEVLAFDCLEFNPGLRWIDPQSDVAFLFMDCLVRDRPDLGYAFVDGYLDAAGDYQGVRLLPLYAAYRSMVRAKVAALRRGQTSGADGEACERRFATHLHWAADWLQRPVGRLVLMCGLSGSGKSFLAERLAPLLPAIRLRTDVARRAGWSGQEEDRPLERAPTGEAGEQIRYAPARRAAVYEVLLEVAEDLLASGEHVIVDATFLAAERRRRFLDLAAEIGSHATVVHCDAPLAVLRQRVAARSAQGTDASEADVAVLEGQRREFEPPGEDAIRIDTSAALDAAGLRDLCRRLLEPAPGTLGPP